MHIGEGECKECKEGIRAETSNKNGISISDAGLHEIEMINFLLDSSADMKYRCYKCGALNTINLKNVNM